MSDESTPLESEVEDFVDDKLATEAPPADIDNPPQPLGDTNGCSPSLEDNHEQN